MAAKPIGSVQQPIAASKTKKRIVWTVVIVSLIWTAFSWSGFSELEGELREALVFSLLLAAGLIGFFVGIVLMVFGLGREFVRNVGFNPFKWYQALFGTDGVFRNIGSDISVSRLFIVGFIANWTCALALGLTEFVGVLVLLPYTAWGILIIPLADIAATMGLRAPVQAKLKQLKRERLSSE